MQPQNTRIAKGIRFDDTHMVQGLLRAFWCVLAVCALLLLPGCRSPVQPPPVEDGMGTLSLAIGQDLRRTIAPNVVITDFVRFDLAFTARTAGNVNYEVDDWNRTQNDPIELAVGTWDLTVTAFLPGPGVGLEAARGTLLGIVVIPNDTVPGQVVLHPIYYEGTGRFGWNISFPDSVVEAEMEILTLPAPYVSYDTVDLIDPGEDHLDMPSGRYRVIVTLYVETGDPSHGPDDRRASLSTVLHVYMNMTSQFNRAFTYRHFPFTLNRILAAWNDLVPGEWNFVTHGILPEHFGLLDIVGITGANFGAITDWFNLLTTAANVPRTPEDMDALVDAALVNVARTAIIGGVYIYQAQAETAILTHIRNTPSDYVEFVWNADGDTVTVHIGDDITYTVTIDFGRQIPRYPLLTGTVSIIGTPAVGEVLTVDTSALDGDGVITFQWQRGIAPNFTDIVGETAGTYTVQLADVGYTIVVTVTRAGREGSVPSAPTAMAYVRHGTATFTVTLAPGHQMQPIPSPSIRQGEQAMFTVANPGDYADIRWFFNGSPASRWISGDQGQTLTLGENEHNDQVMTHTVTVEATRNGVWHGRIVEFEVLPALPWAAPPPDDGFVRVYGGTFLMGSPEGTPNSNDNERPVREVTLSGFYMSRFEVTQGEWYDVMSHLPGTGAGTRRPSFFNGTNNNADATVTPTFEWRNLPVERVTWYDAIVFSNRLSMQRGLTPTYSIGGSTNPADWGPVPTVSDPIWNAVVVVPGSTGYRLPTEAQWEFAARGGIVCQGNFTFSGSNTASAVAWYDGNSGRRTHPVGELLPNALGLYDMSGNVWELVWDWFGNYPDDAQTDPTGPAAGGRRVHRGGGWNHTPDGARSVVRFDYNPGNRYAALGFRLVRP